MVRRAAPIIVFGKMAPGLAVAGHSLVDELAPQQTCIGPAHHGLGVEALYNSLAQTVGYFAIRRVGGQIDPFARVDFEVEELLIVAVYIVVLVLALARHDAGHANRLVRLGEGNAVRRRVVYYADQAIAVVRQ